MYGYEIVRECDLAHHGIKGQKWGVRRFQNKDGSLTSTGKKRYSRYFSSKDTYERIKSLRNNEKRMSRMTDRQKQSLDKAEKYWKARSEGKTPKEKRGLIKRMTDRSRSYSYMARAGQSMAMSMLGDVGKIKMMSSMFGQSPVKMVGRSACSAALGTVGGLAIDEVFNIAFGHF